MNFLIFQELAGLIAGLRQEVEQRGAVRLRVRPPPPDLLVDQPAEPRLEVAEACPGPPRAEIVVNLAREVLSNLAPEPQRRPTRRRSAG